jgi:cephalosporin hydroxylase
MIIRIDTDAATVHVQDGSGSRAIPFSDPEAFTVVSKAWLRVGWDVKDVYRFTWLGRPVIQLPEDLVRLQEAVFATKPDAIVETGVAHGGSLVFFASLCELAGHGVVVGVDIEIRPHNRAAIEAHPLFPRITLIEGDSTAAETFERVRDAVGRAERVFVFLDSNHTKQHVLQELRLYGSLVSAGSYLVAADSIMSDVVGAPRTQPDWDVNNPGAAVEEFLAEEDRFVREEPPRLFDESHVEGSVSYWPGGWLRRIR